MFIRIAAIGVTTLLAAATVFAVPTTANAAPASGTTSLAEVLAADGNRFDRNRHDFDIVDRAVRTVLKAKPNSPVGVLANGKDALTAFLPTDRAFRRLVRDLTGATCPSREAGLHAPSPRSASTPSRRCCSTTSCRARRSPPSRRCRPTARR